MNPACHPDRVHKAKGLCAACYRTQRLSTKPELHEKKLECTRRWRRANPGHRDRANSRRRELYATDPEWRGKVNDRNREAYRSSTPEYKAKVIERTKVRREDPAIRDAERRSSAALARHKKATDPSFVEKAKEAQARSNAKKKLRKEADPEYAEALKAKRQEWWNRKVSDPIYHARFLEQARERNSGWSASAFNAAIEAQCNQCAICGRSFCDSLRPCGDHDHKTKTPRAILCGPCNSGIGLFKEDPERLISAIEYLRRFKV